MSVHYLVRAPENKTDMLTYEFGEEKLYEPYISNLTDHLGRYIMHHDPENYTS